MTYSEYEAHIRSRRDFVRIARKDGSGERQVTGHRCCCPSQEEKGGGAGMWVRKTLVWFRGCEKACLARRWLLCRSVSTKTSSPTLC